MRASPTIRLSSATPGAALTLGDVGGVGERWVGVGGRETGLRSPRVGSQVTPAGMTDQSKADQRDPSSSPPAPRATRRGPRRRLRRALSGAALSVAWLLACGSSDDGDLSKDGRVCEPGTTQACVGPGACDGGQRCADDGSAWSECNCGTGGGPGGTGGDASAVGGSAGTMDGGGLSQGGTAGVGGSGPGGAAGNPTGGAAGGGGTGGAGGGVLNPGDDPCPSQPIGVNCSSSCGGPTANCADVSCQANPTFTIDVSDLPFVVRTPSMPGQDPNCAALCSPALTQFGITVFTNTPGLPGQSIRASVGEGWHWLSRIPTYCLSSGQAAGPGGVCTQVGAAIPLVLPWEFLTDDPAAPARNILLELVPDSETCP